MALAISEEGMPRVLSSNVIASTRDSQASKVAETVRLGRIAHNAFENARLFRATVTSPTRGMYLVGYFWHFTDVTLPGCYLLTRREAGLDDPPHGIHYMLFVANAANAGLPDMDGYMATLAFHRSATAPGHEGWVHAQVETYAAVRLYSLLAKRVR